MRLRKIAAALTVGALALAGCSSGNDASTDSLEVMTWWTSNSEAPAFQVITDAYTSAHPDVNLTDNAVQGGSGGNAQVVLASRLTQGNPPDVWQTFAGGSTSDYQNARQIADISSIYTDEVKAALPQEILDAVTVDGNQYAVPTGAHRSNVLFFNKQVLEQAGISEPGDGYTLDQFLSDLDAVEAAGITPLCLGEKDSFTTAELFENVLLSHVGVEGWQNIQNDRFDWSSDEVTQALNDFGVLLDSTDTDAASASWTDASQQLADGQCGFESMNDSAYAEMVADGADPDSTFGATAFPGTDSAYLAVVDVFVKSSSSSNGANANDFLATVLDPTVAQDFAAEKGSIPVRTDADLSNLSNYQRSASQAMHSGTILWSVAHGEALNSTFQQGYYDAVASYIASRDAAAFSSVLTDAMSGSGVAPNR